MPNPRPSSNRTVEAPLLKYNIRKKTRFGPLVRCCFITVLVMIILLLLIFLIVFVTLPLIFKYSVELQRSLVFPVDELYPDNPEFTNFLKYNIVGIKNLYVNVNKLDNITLGVWHILPEALARNFTHCNCNYTDLLAESRYPILLFFHGNGGNRVGYIELYRVLRIFFHVVAFDYRCYGDSTPGELTEATVVEDSVRLYKWLYAQTNSDIYVWGYSLGSSIATHVIAKLKTENVIPAGLFLEAPFTTLRKEIEYILSNFWFTKVFSWLPWYEATIIDPFEDHGFAFKTVNYITAVNCPIMILYEEDDAAVPYNFSAELYRIVTEKRDSAVQGNVTLQLLPTQFGYNYTRIHVAARLLDYVRSHLETCVEYKESQRNGT